MKVAIRADSSKMIGTGHVSRCLALAEELVADGHEVILITAPLKINWLSDRIKKLDIEVIFVEDNSLDSDTFKQVDPNFIVLDSYFFNHYATKTLFKNFPMLTLVDSNKTEYFSNIYLNQNIGSNNLRLTSPCKGKNLLGPNFALVRKAFRELRKNFKLQHSGAENLLCLIGGSVSSEAPLVISRFLANFEFSGSIKFIGANAFEAEICKILPGRNLEFVEFTPNLDKHLQECDTVISAAGSSVLELSSIGIPAAYIPIADNQKPYLSEIQSSKIGLILSHSVGGEISPGRIEGFEKLLFDRDCRSLYSQNARSLVDGQGVTRTITEMKKFLDSQQ